MRFPTATPKNRRHPTDFHCTAARHRCGRCGQPITRQHTYRGGPRRPGWRHTTAGHDHQATHYLPGCPDSGWATTDRDTAPSTVVA